MGCVRRERTGDCTHCQCPFPDETSHGYECIELISSAAGIYCEVGEGCLEKCEHSYKSQAELEARIKRAEKPKRDPISINDIFNKLTNFKIKFTNDPKASPREIEVSNMPISIRHGTLIFDPDDIEVRLCNDPEDGRPVVEIEFIESDRFLKNEEIPDIQSNTE